MKTGKFEPDYICSIVKKIKEKYKDVAVTLSLENMRKKTIRKCLMQVRTDNLL